MKSMKLRRNHFAALPTHFFLSTQQSGEKKWISRNLGVSECRMFDVPVRPETATSCLPNTKYLLVHRQSIAAIHARTFINYHRAFCLCYWFFTSS